MKKKYFGKTLFEWILSAFMILLVIIGIQDVLPKTIIVILFILSLILYFYSLDKTREIN